MNVFNRIMMILFVLAGLALAVALVMFPWDVIANTLRSGLDGFTTALYDDRNWLMYLASVAVWAVLMVVLFILEVRRPRRKAVRIKTASDGRARLGVDAVVQSLQYRIDELPGVRQVEPRIISHGKNVDVSIDVDTSPTVNVPALTDQIISLCHDIVEGQLGVEIRGRVAINVKHEPYPSGAVPSARAAVDAIAAQNGTDARRVPAPLTPAPFPASPPKAGSDAVSGDAGSQATGTKPTSSSL